MALSGGVSRRTFSVGVRGRLSSWACEFQLSLWARWFQLSLWLGFALWRFLTLELYSLTGGTLGWLWTCWPHWCSTVILSQRFSNSWNVLYKTTKYWSETSLEEDNSSSLFFIFLILYFKEVRSSTKLMYEFFLFVFYSKPRAGLPLNAAHSIVLHYKRGQLDIYRVLSTLFAVGPLFLEQHNISPYFTLSCKLVNLNKNINWTPMHNKRGWS